MTRSRLCPICSRPVTEDSLTSRFRPFCSRRCADIDLGRWLKGGYAIPVPESEDEAQTEPRPPESQSGGPDDTSFQPSARTRIRH